LVTTEPDKLTYGIKQAIHGQIPFFSRKDVFNAKVVEKVAITLALHSDSVPQNSLMHDQKLPLTEVGRITHNLGIAEQSLLHYLGCSELSAAHEDVDMGSVFCQVLMEILASGYLNLEITHKSLPRPQSRHLL
jgi:hypothetical protein